MKNNNKDKYFIELINFFLKIDTTQNRNFNFLYDGIKDLTEVIKITKDKQVNNEEFTLKIKDIKISQEHLNKLSKLDLDDKYISEIKNFLISINEKQTNMTPIILEEKKNKYLKGILKSKIKIDIEKKNFIYTINGEKLFYDNEEMEEIAKEIETLKKKKTKNLNPNTLHLKNRIRDVITNIQKYKSKIEEIHLVKELLWNDEIINIMIEIIYQFIHKTILDKMKYKEKNLERTTFSSNLGNIFINFIISMTLLSQLKNDKYSPTFIENITQILKQKRNDKDLPQLYKNLCNKEKGDEICIPIKEDKISKNVQELLHLYFLTNIFQRNIKKLINPELQIYLQDVEENFYKLFEEFEILKLKIGGVFYEYFKAEKIIYEDKLDEYTIKNKKPSYTLDFDKEIYNELCQSNDIYKPNLVKDINKLKKQDETHNFLHDKMEINRILNKDNYTKVEKPTYKVSIDIRMLVNFLKYLEEIFFLKDSTDDLLLNYKIKAFFSLYDINIETLLRLKESKNKSIQKIVNLLISLAMNLNEYLYNSTLAKEIDSELKLNKITVEVENELMTIYDKILSNKLHIIGLLKESIAYSPFGYFYINSYVDGRFRLYIDGYFLNFQNYPLARAFVKLYNTTDTKIKQNKYENIKNLVANRLPNYLNTKEKKEEFLNTKYEDYEKQEDDMKINFIKKNIINCEKQEIEKLNSWEDILKYTYGKTKKFKTLFENVSNIHQYLEPLEDQDLTIGLDATTSGTQMISIFLQNIETGILSNLIGYDKKDIYQIAAAETKESFIKIIDLKKKIENLFKIKIILLKEKIQLDQFTDLSSFEKRLNTFINLDTKRSYGIPELILALETDLKFIYDEIGQEAVSLLYENIKWLFKSVYSGLIIKNGDETIKKLKGKENFTQYLLLLKASCQINANTNDGDPELISLIFVRKVLKDSIMTHSYNSTAFSRIETHKQNLLDVMRINGYNYKLDLIENLAYFLESMFQVIIKKYLQGCEKLLKIAHELREEPLQITNEYITMILEPKKFKTIRVDVFALNKRKAQLSIRVLTPYHDPEKMKNGIAPNIIHSMDACIVHNFQRNLYFLSNELKEQGFEIGFYTTHDMFWFTMPPYLKLFLCEAYLQLMKGKLYFDNIQKTIANADKLKLFRPTDQEILNYNTYSLNPNLAK